MAALAELNVHDVAHRERRRANGVALFRQPETADVGFEMAASWIRSS
jgi:hypothetical protein